MCEPITMAAIGLASGGLQAHSQLQQGRAAQDQARYQAAVLRNNAILAQHKARDAQERGEKREHDFARQVVQLRARQKAAIAANNMDVATGSPMQILEDTAMLGRADLETIRENTQRERFGFQTQASQFEQQAAMALQAGSNAKQAARKNALGTIGISVLGAGLGLQQAGAFSNPFSRLSRIGRRLRRTQALGPLG